MIDLEDLVGLDFETYSDVDLRKHGLDRYVNSPHFRVLRASIADETGVTSIDMVRETQALVMLRAELLVRPIAAHNAGFEQAVLKRIGIDVPSHMFVDTAVLSRAAGFGSSLEAAAEQVLLRDKLETGAELIKLFCVPQSDTQTEFDPAIIESNLDEWQQFAQYCDRDAELALDLALELINAVSDHELLFASLTMDMNQRGWPVDMVTVRQMNERYKDNLQQIIEEFYDAIPGTDINLNSSTQLIAWCAERGVRTSSFDEKHVASMIKRVTKRRDALPADNPQVAAFDQVLLLLKTKQVLGGSSLKKLDTLENLVGADNRLRHQYLHVGAGATGRTSGKGVQMQNLKRLHGGGDNILLVHDPDAYWSNDRLANNIRQVFAPKEARAQLVVGDFSSVESRGLAWLAGEKWKLDAYAKGQDLYKVQASTMFHAPLDTVTKEQRQVGKVGELSCGYGAGPEAVKDFAEKMGVELSEQEAASLVRDWRDANSRIVELWHTLDSMLHTAVGGNESTYNLPHGDGRLTFTPESAPPSLRQQLDDPNAQSLRIDFSCLEVQFVRWVHGIQQHGRNVKYWKPADRKTGPLWSDTFTNPKTKQRQHYNLYGGKLSGILTQSLCREIFFRSLSGLERALRFYDNTQIIGQFHDEIVVEWHDNGKHPLPLGELIQLMRLHMSSTSLPDFPLAAEVNYAHRYIK